MPDPNRPLSLGDFTRRALVVIGLVVLIAGLVAVVVIASNVLFLFFTAILLAVLLRGTSDLLAPRLGLGEGWSYVLVVLAVVAAIASAGYFFGTEAVTQVNELVANLPKSVEQARGRLREYEWGRKLLDQTPPIQNMLGSAGDAASVAGRFLSTTFGILGNLLVLSVLALYLGASPTTYVNGVVTLVPIRQRGRAREVLSAIGTNLRGWLVGRLMAVAAVGVITTIGLRLVGVPQFLVLGLVAAAFTAIPFLGPLIGAVPGLILALTQGPTTAAYTLGVYALAQLIENYVVTPLVQMRTVHMPPVLTLAAIALFGALTGLLGLIVATPLAVVFKVAIQMLYVEDVLGDKQAVKGAA